MQAAGAESDENIALSNGPGIEKLFSLHRADSKAGQIILAVREIARMFSGLTADQYAARLAATFSDAADHRLGDTDIEFAANKVIQEKQRFGRLRQNIVDAHRHKIDAHRIVNAGGEGDLELGAHAVGRGHQDRLTIAASFQ